MITIASAALLAFSSVSSLGVERFAILSGNNRGAKDEANLRFAETDAERLAQVLTDVGGFLPENIVILKGQSADAMRRAVIAMNDRIRARAGEGAEAVLWVYFSGHADANAIHLGGSALDLTELEQLVRGSAAAYRLLLLDACRSGALTQVKGATIIPPFPIRIEERLNSEGMVFLTSSSANEDAQESDDIGGSFFTHYLASGLLGAADTDGDRRVSLREAYAFAYESTLRASSRTLAGTQHPTFRYELRGKGDLVLSELTDAVDRGLLELPSGRGYLVLSGSAAGNVVAEVGPDDRSRRLSVRSGSYFLRSRGRDHLLEGTVEVAARQRLTVDDAQLERIAYARLVRKGGAELSVVHGPEVGYQMRSRLLEDETIAHGPYASYAIDLAELSLLGRVGLTQASFRNAALSGSTFDVDFELEISRSWDLAPWTFSAVAGGGLSLLHQSFTTSGAAPNRLSAGGIGSADLRIAVDLGAGFQAAATFGGALYLINRQRETDQVVEAIPTVRESLGIAKRW